MSGKAGPVARRRDAKLFRRDLAGWLICRSSCSLGTQLANGSKQKPSHRCYEPVCGGCSERLKYLFSFTRGRLLGSVV